MTTSAVVSAFLFIHLGVILVVTAYYCLGAAIAPRLTERGRLRFARRPWLPMLVGCGVSVPWVIASLLLLNAPSAGLKFAGAAIGCLWILSGLLGGAAIAQHLGLPGDSTEISWSTTARGGLFLSLTWILPLVGWLVMLPLSLAAGVGCLITGAFPARAEGVPVVPIAA